eukprot:gene13433-30219_t
MSHHLVGATVAVEVEAMVMPLRTGAHSNIRYNKSGPGFKHRPTPRSTGARGGRLKPPRLPLKGSNLGGGNGGGLSFQSPRGVSLIVQGTPMRTKKKQNLEEDAMGLAESVKRA